MNKTIAALIAKSKASQGGNYIKPGKYTFEIGVVIAEEKRLGPMWITEFTVLESAKTDPAIEPNAVGSTCSLAVNLSKDAGPGNAKSFCMGAYGVASEDEITEEVLEETAGPAQPLRYMKIKCEAYNKPIRSKPGQVFTACKWEYVAPTDAELQAIAARRAADKAPKK